MPHKIRFIPLVDELTPKGAAISVMNAVFIRRDKTGKKRYIGTNTDCIGVFESFLNRPVLAIGAGDVCRSAVYTLHRWLGVQDFSATIRFVSEPAVARVLSVPFFWYSGLF